MRTTEEKERKYMCMNQAYTEENTLYIWCEAKHLITETKILMKF